MSTADTSVKVAVRIRPLNHEELEYDSIHCVKVGGENQVSVSKSVSGLDIPTTKVFIFFQCLDCCWVRYLFYI